MPLTIVCQDEFYSRVQEGGKWYYVHSPQPPVRASIANAVGGSAFWLRIMPALQGEPDHAQVVERSH